MKFNTVTPESVGISSKNVHEFIKTLDDYGFCTHSIIMSRGTDIFNECYYAPFHKDFNHRMYSVSKSFVSIAVGMAIEDGLISIDDKMIKYFPEYVTDETDVLVKETTIHDMLTMSTAIRYQPLVNWFASNTDDRTKEYFKFTGQKIPGTFYFYDSPASYMLGVIIEKLTGKTFLDYIKDKALLDIGFSKESYCLKCPGGYAWGDSAVMCTSRDLLTFARFVMNEGNVDGKQYMDPEYIREATKKQVNNDDMAVVNIHGIHGYGYQIWKTPNDGFAFIGMGDQIAICDPETDFIFIITSDNQGSGATRAILYHELYKTIINQLGAPLPEDKEAYNELIDYTNNLKLFALKEDRDNFFINEINDVTYTLDQNPMGMEYIKLHFEGKKGTLCYKNAQGEKELKFGIGYNEFGKFPQEGYSDMVGNEYAPGNYYDCACSADWARDKTLRIKVQIIDKYFGNACFMIGFKDERISINITKTAEGFLHEYVGMALGKRKHEV